MSFCTRRSVTGTMHCIVAGSVRVFVLIGAVALCACQTTNTKTEAARDADAEQLARDRTLCSRYGFTVGAEDFAHCVQALRDQRGKTPPY
jgi:hypothetical protein